MDSPWLVVGLGNPGPEYSSTRHNVGGMAVATLASRLNERLTAHKRGRSDVAESRISQQRSVLAIPRSFMNESGGPVSALLDFYKVDPAHLIVVHDELDIAFAALRVKFGGGDGGHNGLKSIRRSIGTGEYLRVRVGIGRPPGRQDPADFVLRAFGSEERKELPVVLDQVADAIESLVVAGLERTQNVYNSIDGKAT